MTKEVVDDIAEDHKFALGQSNKVSSMTQTPGWSDVLEPSLKARQSALEKKILTLKDHADFIEVQQAICAIKNLFAFIDNVIARGKAAVEYFNQENN